MNDISTYFSLGITYNMCSLLLLLELAGSGLVGRRINHQQNPHDTDRGNISIELSLSEQIQLNLTYYYF